MENPSDAPVPMPVLWPALWIGGTNEMLDRTLAITSVLFAERTHIRVSDLSSMDLSTLSPGHPIILEFEDAARTQEWIDESHRIIMSIQNTAEKPTILCVGHQIAAEVVVDWVRAGAFSYVERTADDQHLQLAFQAMAQEAARVRKQYVRYEKLMLLWNSITEREASVLSMLMEGLPNKKIANSLGVSQRTIEARRQKLYEKLESRSVVDVVRTIYELESLENVFHRIDDENDSGLDWTRRASRLLQSLPQLHSDVPNGRFENHDQMKLPLSSGKMD